MGGKAVVRQSATAMNFKLWQLKHISVFFIGFYFLSCCQYHQMELVAVGVPQAFSEHSRRNFRSSLPNLERGSDKVRLG